MYLIGKNFFENHDNTFYNETMEKLASLILLEGIQSSTGGKLETPNKITLHSSVGLYPEAISTLEIHMHKVIYDGTVYNYKILEATAMSIYRRMVE